MLVKSCILSIRRMWRSSVFVVRRRGSSLCMCFCVVLMVSLFIMRFLTLCSVRVILGSVVYEVIVIVVVDVCCYSFAV